MNEAVVDFIRWMTVDPGLLPRSKSRFDDFCLEKRIHVTPQAHGMLNGVNFQAAVSQPKQAFAKVQVSDLGFTADTTYGNICAKGLQFKQLGFCEIVDGAQLRLMYLNQPKKENLRLVMRPTAVTATDQRILALDCDSSGELSLVAAQGRGVELLDPKEFVVFRLLQKNT